MYIKTSLPPIANFSETALLLTSLYSLTAKAYEIYKENGPSIDADHEATLGIYNSQDSYSQSGTLDEDEQSWQEGYVKDGMPCSEIII
ncbi:MULTISPECIES: hypothetical protein [Halomonadaceae]|uniref:hypothetical protein n=1 Tax=Halomonadaceae TaxID=28256 RepID=UPI0012F26061|nr:MULTISPECIES: hypothetical protein [Halomonas]CAD5248756.1 hypothetical protein HALO156_10287 [Halomonas sp. 156]CAD5264797.1 hypothetical protein HALO113_160941 [Halomonas sp. 113]CAD5267145.1 hypothetical protein HALO59_170104 [Halomonas sp. 59]CAD5279462.1 hypothetical protein HALOI3_210285 [Halomonas sp. I3]VXB59356.1 hypothetical protein HALO98_170286 [Halomonas titanicae]|tara:strand:- start:156 stop:419 length:264 start_codon:yes stop_codon:yes gene_type:complete